MSTGVLSDVVDLATGIDRSRRVVGDSGGVVPTGLDGFTVIESARTSPLVSTLYRPAVCLILQGAKVVELGRDAVVCESGRSIIVSHELPIRSRITKATPDLPYLALVLELDVALFRRLADDLDGVADTNPGHRDPRTVALDIGAADDALIDAFRRLLVMCDSPVEGAVLAPLVVREIHVRLLLADHGAALRQLVRRESHASRIGTAIGTIRQHLAEPLAVTDLARSVGMSASSFHEHFKTVTATTPLQYQKELRLLEARELLGAGDRTVTEAAMAVGYRSPTQFSREYSRQFGVPPSVDRDRTPLAG